MNSICPYVVNRISEMSHNQRTLSDGLVGCRTRSVASISNPRMSGEDDPFTKGPLDTRVLLAVDITPIPFRLTCLCSLYTGGK